MTALNVQSCMFVSALECVLPQHGYKVIRSFDMHFDDNAVPQPASTAGQCACGCDYTVLLVYADKPRAALEGTISVKGNAGGAVVALSVPENDGELSAQFPRMLLEAMGMKDISGRRFCCCACD